MTSQPNYGAEVHVFTDGKIMISQKVLIFGKPPKDWMPYETKATVAKTFMTPQGQMTQNFSKPVRFDAESPKAAFAVARELIEHVKKQIQREIDVEAGKPVAAPAALLDQYGRLINRKARRSLGSNGA